jgi:pre-mRNA-splicing factor CWC26
LNSHPSQTILFRLVVENVPTFKGKASTESKWETIKPSERQETKQEGGEDEEEEEAEAEDERPQIVPNNVVAGGLQTAAQIREKFASKKPATVTKHVSDEEPEEETIYRDAQGKKIDTKQMRAEEKRRQARELEKKMTKMEWGKGLVQREDRKKDAEELNKIASQPFARSVSFISEYTYACV